MVGRCDDDIGIGATALDVVGRVGDAGCCVAPCWLAKHLVGMEHGQMFQDELFVGFVGHHEEILIGNNGTETLVCATNETLSRAKDIEKLFGVVVFAERPKTATNAARHNDAVVVHVR